MMKQEQLVIIGSGPAGCTAAVYAARAGLKPVLFAGPTPGGLLTTTTVIENFPGYPEGINGFELVFAMQKQAERFGAEIRYDSISRVQLTDGNAQTLQTASDETLSTQALIIATGAAPRWLDIPSAEPFKGHGISACATCDGAFYRNVPVAVVGGGDSAMEEAITLAKFSGDVHVICRSAELKASKIMAERAKANPLIHFHYSSEVVEFYGGKTLESIRIINRQNGAEDRLPCKGCFMALGHIPSTQLFQDILALDEQGYIITGKNPVCTSLAGVFAAGDCVDNRYRQAITAAGMGCQAAMEAEHYLNHGRII